jgi:hypothetical protein
MRYKCCALASFFLIFNSCLLYASGDFWCGPPRGNVFLRSYNTCNSVPFLSPANDTRLNLQLLLIDAGKLTGNLNAPPEFRIAPDVALLRVPFDFEDWHVDEISSHIARSSTANSAADPDHYAEGEGSRCTSNREGVGAFTQAVKAAALPGSEASILITARTTLVADCNTTTPLNSWRMPEGIRSALGQQFAIYADGANAFYSGEFPLALKDFKSLENSSNQWLKETSRYMIGRTLLNSAQAGAFGEWGDLQLKNVSKNDLTGAEAAFNAYLHDFPSGIYAASARGLLRRVYWLSGDQAQLAEAYVKAFAELEKGNVTASELIQEADKKLLGDVQIERIHSPQLLLIVDLMRMRSGDDASGGAVQNKSAFTMAELEAQKERFARNPQLYSYLLAAFHLYVDDKPEQAIALLPESPNRQLSYFEFSQQTLRVFALQATNQFDREQSLLLKMLPIAGLPLQSEQLQLVLANLEQNTGHLDRVFAPGSPVQDKAIRMILAEYSASPALLRERIKDPKENSDVVNAAIYTLLYKELTGGKYADFQTDLALLPTRPSAILAPFSASPQGKTAGYQCPSLREVASALERDRNDARSLNCVGELVRNHGVHYGQEEAPPRTDLGGGPSPFPVTNYSRLDGYLVVIGDRQADSDARAYALYRAARCYAPSGYNDCGKQDIPLSTRKRWFQMLHQQYPNSVWASSLKIYW